MITTDNNICQVPNVSSNLLPKNYSNVVYKELQKNYFKGERYYLSRDQFNKIKNNEIGIPIYGDDGFICKGKCECNKKVCHCQNHKGKKVQCANYLEGTGGKCNFSSDANYKIDKHGSTCKENFPKTSKSTTRSWVSTHPPILETLDNKIFTCILTYDSEDKHLLNKIPEDISIEETEMSSDVPTSQSTSTTIVVIVTVIIIIFLIIVCLIVFYIRHKKKTKPKKEKEQHLTQGLLP